MSNDDVLRSEYRRPEIETGTILICPYCFEPNQAIMSLEFKKDGHISQIRKCPVCLHRFRTYSALREETTIEDYAKWVVDFGPKWFFHTVDFPIWAHKLRVYGWADRFWAEYRKLHPKLTDDQGNYDKEWQLYDKDKQA